MTNFISSHPANNTPIHRPLADTDSAQARLYCKRRSFLTFTMIGASFFSLANSSMVKTAEARDRNYLWEEIGQPCIKDPGDKRCGNVQEISSGASFTNNGYLVLLDSSQYLTIPSRKITGIEENKEQDALYNYWAHAWGYVEQNYPSAVKSGKVGLAINSEPTRDQDQLHIHMSCMNETVYQQLTKHSSQISSTWNQLMLGPQGQERTWYAIRVNNIKDSNP